MVAFFSLTDDYTDDAHGAFPALLTAVNLDASLLVVTFTGDVLSGSVTVSNASTTAGLQIGTIVTGTGIPVGTRITAISGTTLTLSQSATATNVATSLVGAFYLYTWTEAGWSSQAASFFFLEGARSGSNLVAPAMETNNTLVTLPVYVWLKLVTVATGILVYDFVAPTASNVLGSADDAIWLNGTTQYLDVVLLEAATTQLPWTLDYTSYDTANKSTGDTSARGVTNSTTPVHMVQGVDATTGILGAKHVSINNLDNISHTVTVQILDGSTVVPLIKVTLAVNASLHFDYKTGEWYTLPQASLPVLQGATGPIGFKGQDIPGLDGEDGMDGMPVPGPVGATGAVGAIGQGIPGLDGDEGQEGMPIPGSIGPTGLTGAVGQGIPGMDGDEGQEGMPVPGNQGIPGPQGVTGAVGQGIPGLDGDEGEMGLTIPPSIGDIRQALFLLLLQLGISLTNQSIPGMDGEDGEDGLMVPTPNQASSGGGILTAYVPGTTPKRWYIAGLTSGGTAISSQLYTDGTLYAIPFIGTGGTIDSIGIYLEANATAGATCRIGLYGSSATPLVTPYPTTLLVDSGILATDAGAPKIVAATVSVSTVVGNLYWVAYIQSTGQGTGYKTGVRAGTPIYGSGDNAGFRQAVGTSVHISASYGSLPSTFPGSLSTASIDAVNDNVPAVGVHYSS